MNISIKHTQPATIQPIKNEVISIKYNKKDDFFPDNYYKYDLNGVLETDFKQITLTPKTFVYACCFRVIVSRPNKIVQSPFLEYLLYKYPTSRSAHSNLCLFPFRILGKDNLNQAKKKLLNDLNYKNIDCLGYIQNSKGVFLFYEIPYKTYKINLMKKNNQLWWTTIHEICNLKKILNFPIHNSVTKLFFNNNKLIYLTNKKNNNIQIPTIGYYTESAQLLPFISIMGIKASSARIFGPYYHFTNYQQSFRGAWSSSYLHRQMDEKLVTDENGLLICSGFVRFALFTNKTRVVLYRPTDPFYQFIKNQDSTGEFSKKNKDKQKIKWAKNMILLLLVILNIKIYLVIFKPILYSCRNHLIVLHL